MFAGGFNCQSLEDLAQVDERVEWRGTANTVVVIVVIVIVTIFDLVVIEAGCW